jgi:hypothetical protein
MAESMLRLCGGCEVHLLLPSPEPDDPSLRRLGIAADNFEGVACSPVVTRTLITEDGRARCELLFPTITMRPLAEARGFAEPEALLRAARGVICGDRRLRIEAVSVEYYAGVSYLCRVTAREI